MNRERLRQRNRNRRQLARLRPALDRMLDRIPDWQAHCWPGISVRPLPDGRLEAYLEDLGGGLVPLGIIPADLLD